MHYKVTHGELPEKPIKFI